MRSFLVGPKLIRVNFLETMYIFWFNFFHCDHCSYTVQKCCHSLACFSFVEYFLANNHHWHHLDDWWSFFLFDSCCALLAFLLPSNYHALWVILLSSNVFEHVAFLSQCVLWSFFDFQQLAHSLSSFCFLAASVLSIHFMLSNSCSVSDYFEYAWLVICIFQLEREF